MSPKGLKEYISKENKNPTAFVQGRIPFDLYEKTKEELAKEGISWSRFLTAICKSYIAELEQDKPRKNRLRG